MARAFVGVHELGVAGRRRIALGPQAGEELRHLGRLKFRQRLPEKALVAVLELMGAEHLLFRIRRRAHVPLAVVRSMTAHEFLEVVQDFGFAFGQ